MFNLTMNTKLTFKAIELDDDVAVNGKLYKAGEVVSEEDLLEAINHPDKDCAVYFDFLNEEIHIWSNFADAVVVVANFRSSQTDHTIKKTN